jgi:hypothetical protein
MRLSSLLKYSPGPVRTRLLRDLILLVLFTTGLLVLGSFVVGGELRRELAWSHISRAITQVRDEVFGLTAPVERQLYIARDWLRAGDLQLIDQEAMNARFMPTLAHLDQVSGLMIADEQGREYFLLRGDGEWLTRWRDPGDAGRVTWRRWKAPGDLQDTWHEDLDYDPRERPWFRGALEAQADDGVSWSRPYVFFSRGVPGVTASLAWRREQASLVLGLDVELSKILETLQRLPLGDNGEAFLFRADGGVYVPPRGGVEQGQAPGGERDFFSATASLGSPLALDASHSWLQQGRVADTPIRFASGATTWWGGFSPLHRDRESAWVGAAVPAAGLADLVRDRWQLLLASLLAILLIGGGLGWLLVRKYSHQLKDMPRLHIDREDPAVDLQRLINEGESEHLEFKSTMRTNLKTGKPGKEIELAWLKGAVAFLNTDGGMVLVGVSDAGDVLGLEADAFESEDRCRLHFKNLLAQHIGPEYSRFVRFDLYTLEQGQIGVVECERATRPVFLHHKGQESFFIRNGPSNVELSISRALKYLQDRF